MSASQESSAALAEFKGNVEPAPRSEVGVGSVTRLSAAKSPDAAPESGRSPSSDNSRERIHAAARSLISRYGFDGVSLQKLADEVGLHKSTLFHHYRNKQQIAEEVLEATVASIVAHMEPLLGAEQKSLEQMLELSDRLVDHFSEQPDAARLLLAAMVAPQDSAVHNAGMSSGAVERFYVLLLGWLEGAREAEAIGHVSIRQSVFALMGLMLVYPAVADVESMIIGSEPFSESARRMRKQMLRAAIQGMLRPEA
ncbi:MAG: TetR/AcrR family transcriptional regulator [Polyangiaceae bacterium]|nr:TetR/AcrR family transcriptional regulator [Polyangiaceae bacterium]